ncbi:MAG: hypothetical protein KAW45_00835 [Thermoplasmatales archaeon]|nr:hypothetical protein [Thermoplasmatales archaeon]
MLRKLIGYSVLAILLLSTLVPISPLAEETPWWDNNWSFKEEVLIPINTSDDLAKFQPIDFSFKFNNSCWALNEDEHSVRVILEEDGRFEPLECQIYDLKHIDDEHIESCSIVFLIPEEATGEERYFIYYDDDEQSSPNYPNRVEIIESEYRFEKIPGLVFQSSYYGISQEDYIVYAVSKTGKAIDTHLTQQVAKLKEETETVMPNKVEIGASFHFEYWWDDDGVGPWKHYKTTDKLVRSQKIVDGNLMVKFGIVSESDEGQLRSTVLYKYYYCPTEDKRIHTHVKHELLDYPLPIGQETDVAFITFVNSDLRSNTIEELNFGGIFPYLHFYNEEDMIQTFEMDQYPESKGTMEICKADDYDLGSSAWLSLDEGISGKAHGIIFESNNVVKNGTDEYDGVELQLWEVKSIQLPGLEGSFAFLYLMKNAYEEEGRDDILPENYVVEFNAEFFTTEDGGYPAVAEEAKMYQSLIGYQPTNENNITNDDEEVEKYNLTAYAHFASSFPFGSLLSIGYGYNVSYLTAEIYKDNSYTSPGTVCSVSLCKSIPADFVDLSLIEKLKVIREIFDWKNLTIFKKICFSDLEKGRYLIKIYKENPIFSKERQFIGYGIVDLDKDKKIHIYCKSEGRISLSFLNQNKDGIEKADVTLEKDGIIIASAESDSDGIAVIKAPCGLTEKYTLNVTYKGFLINNEQVRLGKIRRLIPLKKAFSFDVYDFNVSVKDASGKAPSFEIDISVTSDEMDYPISINPDSISDGTYRFEDLYPANYTLSIDYNSYKIKEKIRIPDLDSFSIQLHDFTAYIKDSWNLTSGTSLDVSLRSEEFEETVILTGEKINSGEYHFSNLYPGDYILKVYYRGHTKEIPVIIPNEGNITVVFPAAFNFSAKILDSHGNPLKDAEVLMIREGKEIKGVTDDEGNVTLSLPPGKYTCKIYSGKELIAERKVEVFFGRKILVATTKEPLYPSLIMGLVMISLVGVAIFSFKRKDLKFFLKIFAISLAVVAIVSPWWGVYGSDTDSNLETSTQLFMMPTKMVEITSNGNVTAGDLLPLDGSLKKEIDLLFTKVTLEFEVVMDLIPIIMIIGFIFVIFSLILKIYSKRRLSLMFSILAIIIFIGSLAVFTYATSELANQSVGSFIGNGDIDISIPGEKSYVTMSCSWGPGLAFYLLLFSNIMLVSVFCLNIRRAFFKKLKKMYSKIRKV